MREQWIVVVVAFVLGLLGAGAVWLLRPAHYTANLTMYVSAQTGDSTTAAYQGSLLSQQRVKSYVELLGSTRVGGLVVERLGLTETPEQLAAQINASSTLDTVLLDVAVTDRSPQQAARIVNAVGDIFPGLVTELERPSTPGGTPAVAVRVVQPAAVPIAPSSTGLPAILALGLLAGLGVGIGGALARNALDTSLKSVDQLTEDAGAPNLGTIRYDPEVPKRPLTVHGNPHSPRAEAFRQLRTNLQFVDVDRPRKIIVVTSAVPEEGKTTTICNLAIALAAAGSRVLVIEADMRRPKAADYLGLERAVGLTSVLAEKVSIEHAIQRWANSFDVLASGPIPPNPSELLASLHMQDLLTELRQRYDIVLVDTPPLLPVTDAAAIAPYTDGAIMVCRYRRTSRMQVRQAAEALQAVSATLLGTVFAMAPRSPQAYARYNAYYGAEQPTVPSARSKGSATIWPAPGTNDKFTSSERVYGSATERRALGD